MKKYRSLRLSKSAPTSAVVAVIATVAAIAAAGVVDRRDVRPGDAGVRFAGLPSTASAEARMHARRLADLAALQRFRPGYPFWKHVFTIPDGSIVFGSAADGRRLTTIRATSDSRRESFARRLEAEAGPILHNETRGDFASPGLAAYGPLLAEWGSIYERFGVPREIGLAQALLESGFIGRRRSEADAIGLCQWLDSNWKLMDRLDPAVIEIQNQTTQAAYCAAYIAILATKYDSFIPALSEHHAGGTNVGRVLVNGERLGGKDSREQYFLGSDLAVGLRSISDGGYRDIYGSYGPRSYRYAEMVFGNASTIEETISGAEQKRIYAMRTARKITRDEIARRTGLSVATITRYNPALVKAVPAGATLYLPKYYPALGTDVTFWHRDAPSAFVRLLDEFTALDVPAAEWETRGFAATLKDFERRFRDTATEEGTVMATVLSYVRRETAGPRAKILATFRNSEAIRELFEQGVRAAESAAE
ncbi:MAG: helix-turn-helix transcriptional regulator [Vicinamibacterales bacterium]